MASPNELPKIPSFKTTGKKDEQKAGAGPLSSLGKATRPTTEGKTGGLRFPGFGTKGKMPNLRVRGLPGGTSVIDRLKNLRKKDLMFIGAGLSVLCMAPVAEHLMMSPEDKGPMTEGFGTNDPSMFPEGTAPLDPGTGGFSPGGLVGQGTDVITPLNVRDPSALVMGPGATKKAPAAPPPAASAPPPPTKEVASGGWKDALAQSAKAGAKKASQRAKLPKPNVKMSGALRGLSALGGSSRGGSVSFKLPALQSSGSLGKAAHNASPQAQAGPGFRGAASRSRNSAPGGAEGLKGSGSRQADILNQGGGAANALDTAARETIPGGGGAAAGGGSPHKGEDFKAPGHKKPDDSKSLGESLEFLRRKTEMQNALKLKWKKKEWNEFGRGKMIEETILKSALENIVGKGIFEPIGKAIGGAMGAASAGGSSTKGFICLDPEPAMVDNGYFFESGKHEIIGQNGFKLNDTVNITCKGGLKPVGGAESGPKSPERDKPPSEGEHTGTQPSAAEELGGRANKTYLDHCPTEDKDGKVVEPQADKWSDSFCASMKEINGVGTKTFASIEKHLNESNDAVVSAQEGLAKAAGRLRPAFEKETGNPYQPKQTWGGLIARTQVTFMHLGGSDPNAFPQMKQSQESIKNSVIMKGLSAGKNLQPESVDKKAYDEAKKMIGTEAKETYTTWTAEAKKSEKDPEKIKAILDQVGEYLKQANTELGSAGTEKASADKTLDAHNGGFVAGQGSVAETDSRQGMIQDMRAPLAKYGDNATDLKAQSDHAAIVLKEMRSTLDAAGQAFTDVSSELASKAKAVTEVAFEEVADDGAAPAAAEKVVKVLKPAVQGLEEAATKSKGLIDSSIQAYDTAYQSYKKFPEKKFEAYGRKKAE